jgi:hypothetical protein
LSLSVAAIHKLDVLNAALIFGEQLLEGGAQIAELSYASSAAIQSSILVFAQQANSDGNAKRRGGKSKDIEDAKEHTKGARKSTEGKHQKGRRRTRMDNGGEKGDANRPYHR